jgi:hypothetical protein
MMKKLLLSIILFAAFQAGCNATPIKLDELKNGILNFIYWEEPSLHFDKNAEQCIKRKKALTVTIYKGKGESRGIYALLDIPTSDDAVIVFRKNGDKLEYGYYAEGEALGDDILLGIMKISTKEIDVRELVKGFRYLTAKEAKEFVKNCFENTKNKTYYIGPISETNSYIIVYEKDRNLIYRLPVSPAVLDEAGPHDLGIACPVKKWYPMEFNGGGSLSEPEDASLQEWMKTKTNLLKNGTKVSL